MCQSTENAPYCQYRDGGGEKNFNICPEAAAKHGKNSMPSTPDQKDGACHLETMMGCCHWDGLWGVLLLDCPEYPMHQHQPSSLTRPGPCSSCPEPRRTYALAKRHVLNMFFMWYSWILNSWKRASRRQYSGWNVYYQPTDYFKTEHVPSSAQDLREINSRDPPDLETAGTGKPVYAVPPLHIQ